MRRMWAVTCLALLITALAPVSTAPAHAQSHERQSFFDALPARVQDEILWFADNEEGTLADWTDDGFAYPGGGIFNTGPADQVSAQASQVVAHSGTYSARASIEGAVQGEQGNRAVRLMRWTDAAWDDQGEHFGRRAFYSTWLYIPQDYNPNKYAPWDDGDGGWWNIFQFKANIEESSDSSVPMFAINVDHDDATGKNSLYMYSEVNAPNSFVQANPVPLPSGQWIHLEALYVADTAANGGRIKVFQNGQEIFDVRNVDTIMTPEFPNITWGIGSYTDHIAGGEIRGSADLYFDDSAVSTKRLSRHLQPEARRLQSAGGNIRSAGYR